MGAGDAFNGALAAALAKVKPESRWKAVTGDALAFAQAAAALSVTKEGAQPSMPSRALILRKMKQRRD